MVIALHNLKKAKGAGKKPKRIGRGNASGHGTYSGRGQKGQKARSGVSNLKRLGMKQVLLRTPKERGFKSAKPKAQVVNLSELSKHYRDKDTVSPRTLHKKELIRSAEKPVKILGQGELAAKGLVFEGLELSQSAREKIAKQKGEIK